MYSINVRRISLRNYDKYSLQVWYVLCVAELQKQRNSVENGCCDVMYNDTRTLL